jgi:hypothetical protein
MSNFPINRYNPKSAVKPSIAKFIIKLEMPAYSDGTNIGTIINKIDTMVAGTARETNLFCDTLQPRTITNIQK